MRKAIENEYEHTADDWVQKGLSDPLFPGSHRGGLGVSFGGILRGKEEGLSYPTLGYDDLCRCCMRPC